MSSAIATERLRLRPFREEDAPAVLAYAADESWARFLSLEVASASFTPEEARRFVRASMARTDPPCDFALEREGTVIGSAHLIVDAARSIAELACLIARAHWAHGYAREVGRAMLEHGFATLGLANDEVMYAERSSIADVEPRGRPEQATRRR